MTMMKSEQPKHGQQEKMCSNFHKNFDLNVTAQELEQEPDSQCELIENNYSQYSELFEKTEKNVDNRRTETNKHEEQVPQVKTIEGCVDHLLILAQSAETLAAQSEDSVARTHTNNQNKDQECSQEPLDRSSSVSHASSERCELRYKVTGMRLTQIRKQARCKYRILDQDTAEDNQCKHLQRKTVRLSQIKHQARCKSKNDLSVRLSQIKHQARCKSKNDLSPHMFTEQGNKQRRGRILRLSHMKHLARSKNNATVKEGTEEHMCVNQHCNEYRDSNHCGVEGVPAHNIFGGAGQSSVARRGIENDKECQRAARRLRSFKTKKLRNARLNGSASFLKDKDLITCQEKLPETSGCNENLEANFGRNKLPVQNNVLMFTGLPNSAFRQYDPNMGWMLYMHHVQLKEYHRVVARQHRAERIEEKRALKYKQQNAKNPVLEAKSKAQVELSPIKRLRLTQLKHEVRRGNQCPMSYHART